MYQRDGILVDFILEDEDSPTTVSGMRVDQGKACVECAWDEGQHSPECSLDIKLWDADTAREVAAK